MPGARSGRARRPAFFKAAAKVIDIPWDMAVGSDLQNPEVQGARPLRTRFINWWVRKVFLAAADDPTLSRMFVSVANLSAPPTDLLGPGAIFRVIRHGSAADRPPSRFSAQRPTRPGLPDELICDVCDCSSRARGSASLDRIAADWRRGGSSNWRSRRCRTGSSRRRSPQWRACSRRRPRVRPPGPGLMTKSRRAAAPLGDLDAGGDALRQSRNRLTSKITASSGAPAAWR